MFWDVAGASCSLSDFRDFTSMVSKERMQAVMGRDHASDIALASLSAQQFILFLRIGSIMRTMFKRARLYNVACFPSFIHQSW